MHTVERSTPMKGGEALTGPMWMAIPPEVHSVLLSAGQGAESLLVAATQWQELSKQYTYAAAELTRLLTHVQATSWRGTSATRFVAAHGAYLVWLEQTSINNAITAKQHEIAAIAYSSALAAMPTLAELTANRATRGFLIATNFFGINTIPIALNEADYVRMWVQAADTMATYQAISEAVTATILPTQVAPPILAPGSATQNVLQSVPDWIVQLLTDILDFIADPYKYFLRFFQRLGFRPAIAVVLAIIALQLYDFLWYPYYASYGMLLLPFFAPALSVLGTLSVLWNGQLSAGLPPNPADLTQTITLAHASTLESRHLPRLLPVETHTRATPHPAHPHRLRLTTPYLHPASDTPYPACRHQRSALAPKPAQSHLTLPPTRSGSLPRQEQTRLPPGRTVNEETRPEVAHAVTVTNSLKEPPPWPILSTPPTTPNPRRTQ
uniref:PPE domain-containing protein n=1 Tax=Mycobacterium leprae TaxID=1769 RepID=Q50175_MYCLR|nr:unknown [Mycobacterium leprae]